MHSLLKVTFKTNSYSEVLTRLQIILRKYNVKLLGSFLENYLINQKTRLIKKKKNGNWVYKKKYDSK